MEIIHYTKSIEKSMNTSRNQTLFTSKNHLVIESYTCFRVFGALGQFGETRPKYPNGLGHTEGNVFNSTSDTKWCRQANFHSSISRDRFNLCNQFFNLGMRIYEKKREIYSWIKICSSKKNLKDFQNFDQWPVLFLFCFFLINFLNLKNKTFFFFWIDY